VLLIIGLLALLLVKVSHLLLLIGFEDLTGDGQANALGTGGASNFPLYYLVE